MSGKGRGSLLQMLSEAATASAESNSGGDSGLGSKSPVNISTEYRKLGRGKIVDDLASSYSSLSLGRGGSGAAQKTKPAGETDLSQKTLANTGGGRAQIFKQLRDYTVAADSLPSEASESVQPREVLTAKLIDLDTTTEIPQPKEIVPTKFFDTVKDIHGSSGTTVLLACNYIRLEWLGDPENKGVFVYEVRFIPNVDNSNLRVKYLNEHRDKIGGAKTFDGVTLYLPILLKDKLSTFISKNKADNSDIEVRILFKRKETLKNCIHLYNVLFDRIMKTLNYVRFDRKQFDPTAPKIIPQQKLEVWPGYVTAVDEYEGGLMLCCDVSHRLLCQKTVLDMLVEIYRSSPNSFQDSARKTLIGSIIITRYNNRTYRIDDISFDKNPMSTFPTKDGPISYHDYYLKNHNIAIRDKNQPLLISIKKQKLANSAGDSEDIVFCLIPEICYLTGLTDKMRSDQRLMREIATFTRISPNQRLQALEKFYTNINMCPAAKQILSDWGLSLKQCYETMNGRLFPEEKIYFAARNFGVGPNADFSRHAANSELLEVVNISNWLLIHCKNDGRAAGSLCEHMERNTRAFGMNVGRPKIVVLDNDRVDTFVNALRRNIQKETQIVVCICPTSRDDRYAAIKKICCSEIPIPSQVINAKTLSKEDKNRSIVQKIALQMNCKLGGTLWSVKIPLQNTMICGIDSYHDPSQKGNSVAAFVASLNCSYTKWYSKAVIQTKREEIVGGLCSSFTSALVAYKNVNGRYPENVIIYRDGVGDGQLPLCESFEIPQFEAAYRSLVANNIKITFIVVQKRINTRYFTTRGNGEAQNPAPGTVVDRNITRAKLYDFFLVSQSVKQGTVSPSHYVVLRDDSLYRPDILQRLSYKLCFMYYNWPGTIRIPACCQYAHKLAYLIGQSIRRATSEELADKLFYL